jgi:hypothetical protein
MTVVKRYDFICIVALKNCSVQAKIRKKTEIHKYAALVSFPAYMMAEDILNYEFILQTLSHGCAIAKQV